MKRIKDIIKNIRAQKSVETKSPKLTEPFFVRWLVIGISILFIGVFVCAPLFLVFVKAFEKGAAAYYAAISDEASFSAIKLTLITAVIAVPCNMIFGLAASWLIAKFHFRGKNILTTLIDLPFTVSPVVSGMIFVMLFGLQGWFGSWLYANDIKIIYAVPGIVLATIFVTLPFVARELIPIMQINGTEEEQAALVLGAGGWKTFFHVTFPNIKWALIYGVILCNARAMGEFGAVSVVSGHIRGLTNTIPLHAEILYNEYQMNAAFAVASSLTLLAVITLALKKFAEIKIKQELAESNYISVGENI
ncbi:MAG: sulfate ABC transporter permease subunit CysW [Ignavibacteriales bacterium]|nr:sulfate ABC transporter permease subunit CysW [Ignavibacteriales bacterium]